MKVKNAAAAAVSLILFFSSSVVFAELFRWVDRDGREIFTNDLAKVPQEYRSKAAQVKTDDARVSVGDKPSAAKGPSVAAAEHKDKYGHGEEWWRRRAQNQRLEIRKLEDDYALLLKKEQDRDAAPRKTSGKNKKSSASHDQKKAQLESKLSRARQRLEVDLPDEARRADAYPGWLRE